jgi:hypothetical protein
MKRALVAVFCAATVTTVFATPSPQERAQTQGTASIAGRVTAAATSKPVAGVPVMAVCYENGAQKGATSDAQGRYELTGLPVGRYRLSVRPERYLSMEYGQRPPEPGKPIDLADGERFDKADFSLRRPGAIEGRLVDEFGDPAPNVTLMVSQLQFAAGRHRLMPLGGGRTIPTDDRGAFRITGLNPGAYYVTALAGAFTDQDAAGGFAPTFYPGTTQAGDARPIQVGFGETVSSITFTLIPAPMADLSGTLVAADGSPIDRGTVMLVPGDWQGTSAMTMGRGGSGRDGTFTFRNVPPGSYVLQAFGPPVPGGNPGGLGQATFGWLPVTVNGTNLTNLIVRVTAGTAARGRIIFDDEEGRPKPGDVMVFPRPVEFNSAPVMGGGPPPSVVHDDFTFEVRAMNGLRVVWVNVRAPGWTVKRVSLDGKDVTDVPLDFRTKDVEGLEALLTRRGATVSGNVTDAEGAPVWEYAVIVFAEEPSRWAFPSRFVAVARPSQDGRFKVEGLPPENYLAIAVPSVAGPEQSPEFLESLVRDATRVALAEGEAKTLTLKLVKPR